MDIKEKRQLMCGTAVLLLFATVLFVRSFYSFAWSDESLYMAEVHRLYLGERAFVDEWHPTQFYASLLLPLYRMYVSIKGSTEGIYLWARIFKLILAFSAAEISYCVLKKYYLLENWLSVVGGSMVILYCRANVGGVSYHDFFFFCYTISIMLLYAGVCNYRAKEARYKYGVICWISGLFGGMAIITVPTCALCVMVMYIVLIICTVKRKSMNQFIPVWIHIVGVAMTGVSYLSWLFMKITARDFLNTFHYIFLDSQHQRSLLTVFRGTWSEVSYFGEYVFKAIILLCIVRTGFALYHKIVGDRLRIIMFVLAVIAFVFNVFYRTTSHMHTYLVFSLLGCALFVIFADKIKIENLLRSDVNVFLLLPGVGYIITFMLASASIDPIYGGTAILGIGSLKIVSQFTKSFQINRYRKLVSSVMAGVLMAMIGTLFFVRIITVFRDAPLEMLNAVITRGPAKGLWTTHEHKEQYDECLEMMNYVNSIAHYDEDSMIISVLAPWMYVCTDIHNGGPSPWRIYLDEPLLEDYYNYHKIENLKYVVVLNENIGGYIGAGTREGTALKPNKNTSGGYLGECISSELYERVEFECGTLFVRTGNK